jgi:hypothetical protein
MRELFREILPLVPIRDISMHPKLLRIDRVDELISRFFDQ